MDQLTTNYLYKLITVINYNIFLIMMKLWNYVIAMKDQPSYMVPLASPWQLFGKRSMHFLWQLILQSSTREG